MPSAPETAIILVDHGSRRPEAARHVEKLAQLVSEHRPQWPVRCAHLELTKPFVPEVIDACVADGAARIFLYPFFLLPGRHTREDLPALADDARRRHPNVEIHVTASMELHPKLVEIVLDRIDEASDRPGSLDIS